MGDKDNMGSRIQIRSKVNFGGWFKHRIALKLTAYFSIALLLFSIIIGGVFMILFKNHTVRLQKADLEKRALTIASTLSEFMSGTAIDTKVVAGSGKQGGYGAYLRFLDDIAMTDVWIVDENLQLLVSSHTATQNVQYSDLPQNAESVVKEVFLGKITWSEGFSDLLEAPTLTIGTPIMVDSKVVGALLLHAPVDGVDEGVYQGFEILAISIGAALSLSILLSILLAVAFTRPLEKIRNAALRLAQGDYNARTEVSQKDEIGQLAFTMDGLSEQLRLASQESASLQQMRRDFVANISHELRTPVTVIRGSLEALCDGVVTEPEQVGDYHRQMLAESIFLQRLVNDLLDLSRLQNTDFVIEKQEVSLCELLEDVIRSSGAIARSKNIEIARVIDPERSPVCAITGDYGRLRQMLLIVLDNAIKFSSPGSVVAIESKDRMVLIRDKGKGILAEDLPYVFDRFYKVKSDDNKDGTGLGLAIAKQIADRHGLKLSVTSIPDEGSEFVFEF